MRIINTATKETVYEITTNRSMSLDEALDLMAPADWREQVNSKGYFTDGEDEIYYDDLAMEKRFTVKTDYFDEWYWGMSSGEIEAKQNEGFTEDEITELSKGWGVPVETLLEQLEEI